MLSKRESAESRLETVWVLHWLPGRSRHETLAPCVRSGAAPPPARHRTGPARPSEHENSHGSERGPGPRQGRLGSVSARFGSDPAGRSQGQSAPVARPAARGPAAPPPPAIKLGGGLPGVHPVRRVRLSASGAIAGAPAGLRHNVAWRRRTVPIASVSQHGSESFDRFKKSALMTERFGKQEARARSEPGRVKAGRGALSAQ